MSRAKEKSAWYRDGLRFECTQCGACCAGDPGFVWVGDEEVAALADLMQMEHDEFLRKFVRREGDRFSLVEYPDGDCIFLDPQSKTCTVYSARPVQCRTWPFWDSNLQSQKAWKETCRVCPGAGTGQLYSLPTIEEHRKKKSV